MTLSMTEQTINKALGLIRSFWACYEELPKFQAFVDVGSNRLGIRVS